MGKNENVHPFWAITRHAKIEDVCNCVTATVNAVVVLTTRPEARAKGLAEHAVQTFHVKLPTIINTQAIKADEKLKLRWCKATKEKKGEKRKTWADDLKAEERKRRKAAPRGRPLEFRGRPRG